MFGLFKQFRLTFKIGLTSLSPLSAGLSKKRDYFRMYLYISLDFISLLTQNLEYYT
jgi:fructosamine-3-kinase